MKQKRYTKIMKEENGTISGVFGGISHYLGIDPFWVRIIAVILLFTTQLPLILTYIIAIFVMPEYDYLYDTHDSNYKNEKEK